MKSDIKNISQQLYKMAIGIIIGFIAIRIPYELINMFFDR